VPTISDARPTIRHCLRQTRSVCARKRSELARAKEQYGKLTVESARRLLKFWQVRATDAPPKPN